MTTDRPIPFSPPMVRGLLAFRKSQTRRLLRESAQVLAREPGWSPERRDAGWVFVADLPELKGCLACNEEYKIGDRLWVKEHWRTLLSLDRFNGTELAAQCLEAGYRRPWAPIQYEAGGRSNWIDGGVSGRFRHGRYMPRWASRLTLTVTDVRVQRLQEISRDDVIAEGITERDGLPIEDCVAGWHEPYAALWNSLHGPGAWDANPFVVALTFTVAHGNIDALPQRRIEKARAG